MTGDSAVSDHDGHLEATFTDDFGQKSVAEILLLGLLPARFAAVSEGAVAQ